jgi:hypothetical protein
MKLPIIAATCLLLGIVAGWYTRGVSAKAGALPEIRVSPREARSSREAKRAGVPANVSALLAAIDAARSTEERLRAIIHLAHSIPVSEIPRWYDNDWFDSRKDADTNIFLEITRNRWLREDPDGLLDYARLRNWTTLDDVAARWARKDPDRALRYLESIDSSKDKIRLKMAMLDGFIESRPELVVATAVENLDDGNSYQWKELFKKLARVNPFLLEAAEFPGHLKVTVSRALLMARLEQDADGEVTRHLSLPDGANSLAAAMGENYELGRKVSASIIHRLDALPAKFLEVLGRSPHPLVHDNPAAWLEADLAGLGLKPEVVKEFHRAAINRLVHCSPEDALQYLRSNEVDRDQLVQLTATALGHLQLSDPAKASAWQANMIAHASDDNFSTELAAQLEQRRSVRLDSVDAVLARIEETSDSGSGWQLTHALQSALPKVRREFERQLKVMDPKEVAALIRNQDLSQLNSELQAALLSAATPHLLDAEEPNHFTERYNPVYASAALVSDWVQSDPIAASRWTESLPPGEARVWALRNLAANWLPYDTPAANAWIAKLPTKEQADVKDFLRREVAK